VCYLAWSSAADGTANDGGGQALTGSSGTSSLLGVDRDDVDQVVKPLEVRRIAGEQRDVEGQSCRRDEQVHRAPTSCFPPRRRYGSIDAPIRTRCVRVEWQGVEGPLGSLEMILPSGSFLDVVRRVRSDGELGEGGRRLGNLSGQLRAVSVGHSNDRRG